MENQRLTRINLQYIIFQSCKFIGNKNVFHKIDRGIFQHRSQKKKIMLLSINVDGGFILIGQETSGSMDLAVGEEKTAHAFVLRFGRPTITATADTFEETTTGFVFLFFVVAVQQ